MCGYLSNLKYKNQYLNLDTLAWIFMVRAYFFLGYFDRLPLLVCVLCEYYLISVRFRYARARPDMCISAAADPIFVLPYFCVQLQYYY